ncbi:hypothetical protein VKT23_017764 [Stygiomarasmius scandens]|uniref:BTB domain-containing protein n=1 Tax=Marasmiellus scandens TaxID=2682957 RepID=A0ABR1IVL7_9AGAR
MENLAPTGRNTTFGFRLEDWIDTSNVPTDQSNTSAPLFSSTTWDPNAVANTDAASLAGPSFVGTSHPRPTLSAENSLGRALDDYSMDMRRSDQKDMSGFQTQQVTLSTAFQEMPATSNRPTPDVVLVSSDAVVFYVDEGTLLKASYNSFGDLLPITSTKKAERVRNLHDTPSSELNVLLHILYNLDCAQYNPPLPIIISAIDHLPKYGLSPKTLITPQNPIYQLLLTNATIYPLEVYSLCGKYDIYELAVAVSPHLLSLTLSSVTDKDAERMGSLYLARLFRLHRTRVETLFKSLMPPPSLHNPTRKCGFESQKALASAWTMTTAYLSWSAKPGR